ncbi:MAG: hypothetical protein K2K21_03250 [Lachnospiraceae bacterium]|nr:hypothetical protein [Lachnospiraceae bacterium]
MKEFATEVSENYDERRTDSKGNSDMMIFYILGAILLAVCILCLILLWQKKANSERTGLKSETFTEAADIVLTESPESSLSELHESTSGEVFETELSEYTEEEMIRQQYLTDIEYLREKVEVLLQSMSETKDTLEEVVLAQEEDDVLKEQVSEITSDITQLTIQLQNAQKRIRELKESITAMNNETILVIQENIAEIEGQMSDMDSDISNIYIKIDTLKAMDAELQNKIDEIEKNLKTSAEQNMTNVTNQFNSMSDKMQQIESQLLQHSYDAGTNTLYLYSN